MKTLIAFIGAMVLSAASHAAVMTFQYTARVTGIADGVDFGSAGTSVSSIALPDGTVMEGDMVTGMFRYDDAAAPSFLQDFNYGAQARYDGVAPSATFDARFGGSGPYVGGPAGDTKVVVWDINQGVGVGDSFGITNLYSRTNANVTETLVLTIALGSLSDAVLDSVALPGAALLGFDIRSFQLDYNRPVLLGNSTARIRGDITSLRFVPPAADVPEPSTLAVMAAGLGLLARRRKRG